MARRSGVSRPRIYEALGEDEERSHAGGMASTAVTSFETIRSILTVMGLRLKVEAAQAEAIETFLVRPRATIA